MSDFASSVAITPRENLSKKGIKNAQTIDKEIAEGKANGSRQGNSNSRLPLIVASIKYQKNGIRCLHNSQGQITSRWRQRPALATGMS
jgi:hypothetical protein